MSSGAEFPSKASEIARHFETEGTPIMIGTQERAQGVGYARGPLTHQTPRHAIARTMRTGGGVLAYTLLGIDWNRETGGTRYLILDPHYTGADDVSSVIAKGWCAWKVRLPSLAPPQRESILTQSGCNYTCFFTACKSIQCKRLLQLVSPTAASHTVTEYRMYTQT